MAKADSKVRLSAGTNERRSAELGDRYRELESEIIALRGAALLLDLAIEQIWRSGAEDLSYIKPPPGTYFKFYAMTEDQLASIDHAVAHMGDVARRVHRQYYDDVEK